MQTTMTSVLMTVLILVHPMLSQVGLYSTPSQDLQVTQFTLSQSQPSIVLGTIPHQQLTKHVCTCTCTDVLVVNCSQAPYEHATCSVKVLYTIASC